MLVKRNLPIILLAVILAACNPLSKRAKEIAGNYYITELSQDTPVMELNADGSCTMRAIRPGVLTFEVPGTWNVEDDSLLVVTDPTQITAVGDTTLIGDVPARMSKAVVNFNGTTLTLRAGGTDYVYHRRGVNKD